MEQNFETLLADRYGELSSKLREIVGRPGTLVTVSLIGEKHHLTPEKIDMLRQIVLLTLLAFQTTDDFEEALVKELLIPGSIAASIAKDVDAAVFAEVRNDLDKLYAAQIKAEKEAAAATPTQAPKAEARAAQPQTRAHETYVPPPLPTAPSADAERSLYGQAKPLTETPSYGDAPSNIPTAPPASRRADSNDPYREAL